MKDRCYNENHISFKYYGGRGITICNDWFNNFDLFEAWALDNNYQSHLTLVAFIPSLSNLKLFISAATPNTQ